MRRTRLANLPVAAATLLSMLVIWQILPNQLVRSAILAGPASSDPARFSCRAACLSGAHTPYCMEVPRDARAATGLSKMRAHFANANASTLSRDDLKRAFAVSDDPCRRGDTVRTGDTWENDGAACMIVVKLDMFGDGSPVPVSLGIPEQVIFGVSHSQDRLSLIPRGTSTVVQIGDPGLQNDWGGLISEVISTPGATLFQVPKGCLMVPS